MVDVWRGHPMSGVPPTNSDYVGARFIGVMLASESCQKVAHGSNCTHQNLIRFDSTYSGQKHGMETRNLRIGIFWVPDLTCLFIDEARVLRFPHFEKKAQKYLPVALSIKVAPYHPDTGIGTVALVACALSRCC